MVIIQKKNRLIQRGDARQFESRARGIPREIVPPNFGKEIFKICRARNHPSDLLTLKVQSVIFPNFLSKITQNYQ